MPAPVIRRPEVAIRGQIGRAGVIFDDNDVIRLLRAAVEREGSQTAFARRHGIERTTINAILSGKRPVTESVANALGLRRTSPPSERDAMPVPPPWSVEEQEACSHGLRTCTLRPTPQGLRSCR